MASIDAIRTPTQVPPAAPDLKDEIRRLATPDDRTNLVCLAREYLIIAAVATATIALVESRASLGLGWVALAPVLALAVVIMGALQHRLAGLGHEAAHFTLLAGRLRNDLVGDLFCLIPLLTTVHFYRAFHAAHHRHTNDPDHDPEMVHMGTSKRIDAFPMSRPRFVAEFLLAPLAAPASFVRYGLAYIVVTVLGLGVHRRGGRRGAIRLALGLLYVLGMLAAQAAIALDHRGPAWSVAAGLIGLGLVAAVLPALPAIPDDRGPWPFGQPPYSPRVSAGLRLAYITAALTLLGALHGPTGGRSTAYFGLLWALPICSSFLYVMRLRDVFHHANADTGRLTNSRVFRCTPVMRWALFMYGQDMHVTHHFIPTVPHHRLPELHDLLMRRNPEYASQVVECAGLFARRDTRPTILDTMTRPLTP